MTVTVLKNDCREILRDLPEKSVHCVVTSPPYFGLRDYDVAGQIGIEPSPDEFVAKLIAVFRDVRRVLRDDGTLWLNLGDSYAGSWGNQGRKDGRGTQRPINGGMLTPVLDGRYPAKQSNTGKIPQGFGLKPKDLIGIPWRVAFALQAPDYLGRITRESDRAWLAALIDGEGCISILETTSGRQSGPVSTSYPPILQVRMCDPECIQKAMLLVGSESENPAQYPPSMAGQRPAYQWRIHGRKAADIIAEIYPFLLIKRKQAIVAWNAQASREGYETKRGVKVPVEFSEKQKFCREIIHKLNQREPVDLPSWMIEPPMPYGPGWYLRQDLIWSKPNPMPESVTDRCTKAHEYIFLMSKSARYFYDAAAIAEDIAQSSVERLSQPNLENQIGSERVPGKTNGTMKAVGRLGLNANASLVMSGKRDCFPTGGKRNRRSVWEVASQPFSEAHFATFPPALIEPCILAGCPIGGTVLDPFGGAGTTGLVADRYGRNAILIELNPDYALMAARRIKSDAGMFADVKTSLGTLTQTQTLLLDEKIGATP